MVNPISERQLVSPERLGEWREGYVTHDCNQSFRLLISVDDSANKTAGEPAKADILKRKQSIQQYPQFKEKQFKIFAGGFDFFFPPTPDSSLAYRIIVLNWMMKTALLGLLQRDFILLSRVPLPVSTAAHSLAHILWYSGAGGERDSLSSESRGLVTFTAVTTITTARPTNEQTRLLLVLSYRSVESSSKIPILRLMIGTILSVSSGDVLNRRLRLATDLFKHLVIVYYLHNRREQKRWNTWNCYRDILWTRKK